MSKLTTYGDTIVLRHPGGLWLAYRGGLYFRWIRARCRREAYRKAVRHIDAEIALNARHAVTKTTSPGGES